MRVLVIVVIVVVIVTWESKANSSSSLTELQTGTELGKNVFFLFCVLKITTTWPHNLAHSAMLPR